ncbi:aminotransferase class I/II-fold pyridoxal phosphate-dependent enzyme [uncultured Jannaschia sp.]|uniref:aminotransferase class I/II-fold pyridoxal phosphate-dependent enzyme n=1 Tax=uncultured Jannaschia sp. TaxID=293347 RepID=UPI00262ACA5A|nr:aminotransferase class I/II-fold pyridoxal phosphate-dependent enzyme [uncultured Jannaschia sp.]
MQIDPFGVEMWMNAHETRCRHNIAETCVDSLTVGELLRLAGRNDDDLSALLAMKMTYGAIPGSDALRGAIAALYADRAAADVMICHGTAGANALVWQAMVGAGDRVVTLVPTYQQHVSIPKALGAEVVEVPLRPEDWLPDLDALQAAARPGTKMIALTNPNNPTGSLIDGDLLAEIVRIARAAGADLLVDEVYRGTAQTGPGATPSVVDLYERGIATGGMSKAFSMAGLRLGWVVGPPDVLEAVSHHRDYTTISVGRIDDHLATIALEQADRILARSRAITRDNLAIVDDWLATEPLVDWVRPRAGTVGLLRYDLDLPSERLCLDLLDEQGVLLTPGAVMGAEGYLRIGFGNPAETLRAALPKLSAFLRRRAAQ